MEMFLCFVVYCACMTQIFACPQVCACINQHVNCYGRNLYSMSSGIPEDTVNLNFGNNEIARIDSLKFVNLSELHELVLKYNKISSLEMKTFLYLTTLQILDLGSNQIKILEEGVFDGLSNLKEIDLSENFIQNIDHVFDGLHMLEKLDLGSNKIKTINKMVFKDLKNLMYLYLPNNEITKIDRLAFQPIQKLSWITLTKNPLKNANALFIKNRQLSYVDLSQCAITSVPRKLPPSLEYLQLTNNNITRIKATDFSRNTKLKFLVLAQNQIDVIENGAFSPLKNLQELRLTDNKLREFPPLLPASVNAIYLSKNKIQQLSCDDFPANSQLTTLSLKSNEISNLQPGTFSKLKKLSKLYLDSNRITVLKNKTFSGLDKLSLLSLSKNFITLVEKDVFFALKSLTKLEMAFVPGINNKSTKVEGNILLNIPNLKVLNLQSSPAIAKRVIQSDMLLLATNLKEVNLMNNNLSTINPQIRRYLENADVVKLSGNMWHCDRRLVFLKKWMNSNLRKFFLSSQVTCFLPGGLKGKRISALKNKQFVRVVDVQREKISTTSSLTVTTPFSSNFTSSNPINTVMLSAKTTTFTSMSPYSKTISNTADNINTTPQHEVKTKIFTSENFRTSSSRPLIVTTPNTNKKRKKQRKKTKKNQKKLFRTAKAYRRQKNIKTDSPFGESPTPIEMTGSEQAVQISGTSAKAYTRELDINTTSPPKVVTMSQKTKEKTKDQNKDKFGTDLKMHPRNQNTKTKHPSGTVTRKSQKITRKTRIKSRKKSKTRDSPSKDTTKTTQKPYTKARKQQYKSVKTTSNIYTETLSTKETSSRKLTTMIPKRNEQANNQNVLKYGTSTSMYKTTFNINVDSSSEVPKEIRMTKTFETTQSEDSQTTTSNYIKTGNPFQGVTTVSPTGLLNTEANEEIVRTVGTTEQIHTIKERMTANSLSTGISTVTQIPNEKVQELGAIVKLKEGTLTRKTDSVEQSVNQKSDDLIVSPISLRNKSDETMSVTEDETYLFDTPHVDENSDPTENNGRLNTSGLPTNDDSVPKEIPTTVSESNEDTDVVVVFTFISVFTVIVVVIMGLLVHRQYGRTK